MFNKLLINIITSFIFLLGFSFYGTAQTISGTINNYTKVVSFNSNNTSVDVTDASTFSINDTVFIIQMQGAEAYSFDNISYGNITKYNSAGLFEYAIICDITNNTIFFNAELLNSYNSSGSVQLVSVPKYKNVTINGTLTGKPWDGETGGIIILEATNTVTLNANINASGLGFRGGIADSSTYNCVWFDNFSNYAYDLSSGHGAMKGEGIAKYGTKTAGKGAWTNGGGGGNDHNTGGGGGANLSPGGKGGNNNDPNTNNCTGFNPGKGGKKLNKSSSTVFMGGGGGAGHANNNITTSGGNGGGIVILTANAIQGNGNKIIANGSNGGNALNDGGGAGGAGGSILLNTKTFNNSLTVETKGGNGGNVDANTQNRCFGPGGGGSGGQIWYKNNSTPNNVTSILTGGAKGIISNSSASCNGQSNGAKNGSQGIEDYKLQLKTNATFAKVPILDLGNDKSFCINDILILNAPKNASHYFWSTGSTEQSIEIIAPGYYNLMVIYGACTQTDTIFIDILSAPNIVLPTDTILCSYLGVDLDAGNENSNFIWSTGETTQVINTKQEGKFTVTITNENNCSIDTKITVSACVNNLEIPNLITPNGDGNNDTWIIETIYSYPGNSIEIYNRNGALLFRQENYNNNWKGNGLPASTYFYIIDFNNGGNKQSGSISIVREQ